jgi:hypothetical protein
MTAASSVRIAATVATAHRAPRSLKPNLEAACQSLYVLNLLLAPLLLGGFGLL